jgi:hypothetical protein
MSGPAAWLSIAGEAERVGVLVEGGLEQLDLLLDVALLLGAFEGDGDVELLGGLLGALLDGLPELVLEALGDEGDVRLLVASGSPVAAAGGATGEREGHSDRGDRCGQQSLLH